MSTVVITFVIYMLAVLLFGIFFSRGVKKYEDYIIGGRSVGPIVSSLSLVSSYASGYTYTAAPGLGYSQGYGALWYASGDGLGTALSFGVLGRRLRKSSGLLNAISIPEFYERRFSSPGLRVLTSLLLLVTITVYLIAQWVASGLLISVTFGVDYVWGMLIASSVVVIYTALGGYIAVVYTDAMQMVVMFVGSQLLFWVALFQVGGWNALNDRVAAIDPDLVTPWGPDAIYFGVLVALTPVLLIVLGALGLPHMTVRHLSLNKPSSARKAMLFTAVLVISFSFIYYMTGPLALAVLGEGQDPERVGALLWEAVLPPVLVGLLVSAAVASIQSTASSFLILLVTTIGHDLLYRFGRSFGTERRRTNIARIIALVVTIATFMIAISPPGLVFEIVIFNFGILALGFAVPNIFALFWRRTTKVGVIACMVLSVTVYVYLDLTGNTVLGLNPFLSGLVVALLAIVIGSLVSGGPSADQEAVFDEAASYEELPSLVVEGQSKDLRREMEFVARHPQGGALRWPGVGRIPGLEIGR